MTNIPRDNNSFDQQLEDMYQDVKEKSEQFNKTKLPDTLVHLLKHLTTSQAAEKQRLMARAIPLLPRMNNMQIGKIVSDAAILAAQLDNCHPSIRSDKGIERVQERFRGTMDQFFGALEELDGRDDPPGLSPFEWERLSLPEGDEDVANGRDFSHIHFKDSAVEILVDIRVRDLAKIERLLDSEFRFRLPTYFLSESTRRLFLDKFDTTVNLLFSEILPNDHPQIIDHPKYKAAVERARNNLKRTRKSIEKVSSATGTAEEIGRTAREASKQLTDLITSISAIFDAFSGKKPPPPPPPPRKGFQT